MHTSTLLMYAVIIILLRNFHWILRLVVVPLATAIPALTSFIPSLQKIAQYIHIFLAALDTCVHELAHALTAFLVGFKPQKIDINANLSGLATYNATYNNKFVYHLKMALIAFVGYPAPLLLGVAYIYLILEGYAFYVLVVTTALVLFTLVFFIRNKFGITWAFLFITFLTLVGTFGNTDLQLHIACLVTLALYLGAISHIWIVTKMTVRPNHDTENQVLPDTVVVAQHTFIPSIIWACTYVALACYSLYYFYLFLV